ncbi:MAG: twin-arginine translocase subunit TatC [Firmicutes bacterium]|nr:twin-arginine translocase subunit TatC [Bacillota bacterium]
MTLPVSDGPEGPEEGGTAVAPAANGGSEMTLVGHLDELRKRLIWASASLIAGTVGGWFLAPGILRSFARDAGGFVYLAPAEAFASYLKTAVAIGCVLASPVILAEAWLFVVPGLYPGERRAALRYLPGALALFGLGLAFGYYVAYPVALLFLLGFGSQRLVPALAVSRYLMFVFSLTVPFGLAFQLPLVASFLTRQGVLSPEFLRRKRRGAYLLAFVLGGVFTPPDVISQLLLAVPLVLVFELSIVTSSRSARWRERSVKEPEIEDEPALEGKQAPE